MCLGIQVVKVILLNSVYSTVLLRLLQNAVQCYIVFYAGFHSTGQCKAKM